ncbi:MAG: hypothetical protein OXF39_06410 [Nitrospira sp.]|nr:hypothetical protein [Nitrospira sp.]
MKLQSVILARSIWLFPTEDLNPQGKSLLPILKPLIERYRFLVYPKTAEQLTGNEMKFEEGQFLGKDGNSVSISLNIYRDGFVADTRASTDDSDSFLHDLLGWLHSEQGLLQYDTMVQIRKKLYASALFVTCDQLENNLYPGLHDFMEDMSRRAPLSGGNLPVQITGLSFGYDPGNSTSEAYDFKFERAVKTPFDENRYYSWAPFPTEMHLSLLEKLEEALSQQE